MKQKSELEKFNEEDQEALQRFQDNQNKELELTEIAFEEERREIIKRNEPRRKAIKEIHSKRENIEAILLKVLQK